jgi:hypothetical protein
MAKSKPYDHEAEPDGDHSDDDVDEQPLSIEDGVEHLTTSLLDHLRKNIVGTHFTSYEIKSVKSTYFIRS